LSWGNGREGVNRTGGADNTITAGNGNDTIVASGDSNDTITVGQGNDTVYLGDDDTLNMGKGSELVVVPSSQPTVTNVSSITALEDTTISLASAGLSVSTTALGFDTETISGFSNADQLEFTTAQFANFSAVMADATQVGANTVITDGTTTDTITLDNVAKSSLSTKNFLFVSAGSGANVTVTITGLPTITTPVITGTAKEGQTLTASASSGQSDNPVTYAWYSSADSYHTAIGTGATYQVQEGDENHTIEVKATATNDNGATASATSAATASVIDNSSLALSVSVAANGSVQQGQTLVATAIPGDPDDVNAFVTYQWQSSSDGLTWTNVAATASGGFGGPGPSSFYQLTEADEDKQFRVMASFTDDTGQVVSTTSAPTAVVADVTPEITVPFSYAVDDLSIVKNGSDGTIVQSGPAPSTFDNSGSLVLADGTSMALSGVVDNTGSIATAAQSAATSLVVSGEAVLEGGGSITLSDNTLNAITGDGSAGLLSNVDNTITGAGEIGGGGLSLINKGGVIDATGTNALILDTGSNGIVNTGTLEATGTGGLVVKSALSGDGAAIIGAGSEIELAGAADSAVSFAGATGTLQLDASQGFTGTIADFGGADQIDLGDIGFGGTNTANIALLGQYAAASFATASDGNGGTMVTSVDPAQQNQLASGH
jgi:hypothetical protein